MPETPPDGPPPLTYFVRGGSVAARAIRPGITLQATAGEALMVSVVRFEPGADLPTHSHPHEQMGLLLEGRLEFTVGGETAILEAGDLWRIPGGVPHSARALGRSAVALDVFHPVRDDYR